MAQHLNNRSPVKWEERTEYRKFHEIVNETIQENFPGPKDRSFQIEMS
jgi:hypothetical protein